MEYDFFLGPATIKSCLLILRETQILINIFFLESKWRFLALLYKETPQKSSLSTFVQRDFFFFFRMQKLSKMWSGEVQVQIHMTQTSTPSDMSTVFAVLGLSLFSKSTHFPLLDHFPPQLLPDIT